MTYGIRYQPRAVQEYESAAVWYRERSEQAAINFIAAVKEKTDILKSDPLRYGKRYKEFRELRLKKYPFNLIYFVNEDAKLVIISSIYHHKRNPKTKYRRMR